MTDADCRAAIQRHWAASQAGDEAAEHAIYADDAVLEYPQSGERFRGRRNIQGQRGHHRHIGSSTSGACAAAAICGSANVISYDGKPYDTVSIMVFGDQRVSRRSTSLSPLKPPPGGRSGPIRGSRREEHEPTPIAQAVRRLVVAHIPATSDPNRAMLRTLPV